jgi:hypothetical protein
MGKDKFLYFLPMRTRLSHQFSFSYRILVAFLSATLNAFIVTSRDGFQTTFSDWAGPVKEIGRNIGWVSGAHGWSKTYTTNGLGVGPGISISKFGTPFYSTGITFLIGEPFKDTDKFILGTHAEH